MAYKIFKLHGSYGPRKGLEGPFEYFNGRVLYYDVKEGRYWDPRTDFYLDDEEIASLHNGLINLLK